MIDFSNLTTEELCARIYAALLENELPGLCNAVSHLQETIEALQQQNRIFDRETLALRAELKELKASAEEVFSSAESVAWSGPNDTFSDIVQAVGHDSEA